MIGKVTDAVQLLYELNERAKELHCLYEIDKILRNEDAELKDVFHKLTEAIPKGWQFSAICKAAIIFDGIKYAPEGFEDSKWYQSAEIIVEDHIRGSVEVHYTEYREEFQKRVFLLEEDKLIKTVAEKIDIFILNRTNKTKIKGNKHYKWRLKAANEIADKLNTFGDAYDRFGVVAIYLIGSTKNATAGPSSDIDLLVHFKGNEIQKQMLKSWIEGWSLCLSGINYEKTGFATDGLIDLHIITDEDIENRESFASKIGAVNDGAKLLKSYLPI